MHFALVASNMFVIAPLPPIHFRKEMRHAKLVHVSTGDGWFPTDLK